MIVYHPVNVRRGRRIPEPLSEGQRGHPDRLAKDRTKIALVAEAHFLAELRDRHVRRRQHRLRFGDAEVIEVRNKRLPGNAFEEAHKVRLAEAQGTGRAIDADRLIVMRFQEFEHGDNAATRLLPGVVGVPVTQIGRIMAQQQDQNHP